MKKHFSLFAVTLMMFTASLISGIMNWNAGYMNGQREALQGIYKIDQAERDMLDPEGKRHILAQN